ncbi:hypothetical protein AGMMS50249_7580 [candidate division SR1 bacterium]|nr:hypothetical protein AGMMS50249_7580 [candidate division SR1 bacterium]
MEEKRFFGVIAKNPDIVFSNWFLRFIQDDDGVDVSFRITTEYNI